MLRSGAIRLRGGACGALQGVSMRGRIAFRNPSTSGLRPPPCSHTRLRLWVEHLRSGPWRAMGLRTCTGGTHIQWHVDPTGVQTRWARFVSVWQSLLMSNCAS